MGFCKVSELEAGLATPTVLALWLGSPTDMYLEFWMSEASGLGNQGTTEVSPVPEMGLPKDEASGQSFLSHTQTLEVGWGTKLDQRLGHYFDEPTKTLRVVNGNYESFENY